MNDLAEIHRALGRIEGTVTAIKEGMERGAERMDKQAEQIGDLRRRQHWYSGFAAAVGMLLGFGTSHFPKL